MLESTIMCVGSWHLADTAQCLLFKKAVCAIAVRHAVFPVTGMFCLQNHRVLCVAETV